MNAVVAASVRHHCTSGLQEQRYQQICAVNTVCGYLLLTRHTNNRLELFKTLMTGLFEQNLIEQSTADKLLQMWQARDEPLLQSLQLYRQTNDLGTLINTLQRMP
jgi:CDP-diacylglycerol pyrophosphatase